jgi:hypothetical protein
MKTVKSMTLRKTLPAAFLSFLLLSALWPSTALADGETGATGNFLWAVLPGNTSVRITSYSGTPSGNLVIPDDVDASAWGYGTLPVTQISSSVFQGQTGITGIGLPASLQTIPNNAFLNCTGLQSVTFNSGLQIIGYGAFYGCTSLNNLSLPNTLMFVQEVAFANCTSLSSVTLPDSVSSASIRVFEGCTNLASATLPANAGFTVIPDRFFNNCTALASITIPDNVTDLGSRAFFNTGFTSFEIPKNVTSLTADNFLGCTHLNNFSVAPGNTAYIADGGIVYSAGHGTLVMYPPARPGAFAVPAGVTDIGDYAFFTCAGLTDITLDGVAHIHEGAFNGCAGLTGLTIPSTVTTMDPYAFSNCAGLTGVTIPASIGSISFQAFANCIHLESLDIPEGITAIEGNAFFSCTALESLTIPGTVVSIGDSAFFLCTSLSRAVVLSGSTTFGNNVFDGTALGSDGIYGHDGSTAQAYAAVNSIPFNLLLALTVSPASGHIYTGGRATITPNLAGGTWTFPGSLLSRDGNEFTGLAAGTAHVTYTMGWQSESEDILITNSGLPSTGQDFTLPALLAALAAFAGAAAFAYASAQRRRRRAQ